MMNVQSICALDADIRSAWAAYALLLCRYTYKDIYAWEYKSVIYMYIITHLYSNVNMHREYLYLFYMNSYRYINESYISWNILQKTQLLRRNIGKCPISC